MNKKPAPSLRHVDQTVRKSDGTVLLVLRAYAEESHAVIEAVEPRRALAALTRREIR